jgi:hypothetical protein
VSTARSPWSPVPQCIDYISFVRPLPSLDLERWQGLVMRLARLGRCEHDACGVITARGRWGFFLIPPRGFPEIKVCFHRRSSPRERLRRLQLLEACFLDQGESQ